MASLKVFVSSTYYDLHHVRNQLYNFLLEMGYEAVMHEKGGVAYTQDEPLEESCYNELSLCDIVVCVIGNKYGSKSEIGDYSITMKELQRALKEKKKVYTFIVKDVFIENVTYEKNLNKGNFEPAYVDNIKIHEFIADLKKTVKNNPILPFESVDDIVKNLKSQFSGLFQNLLAHEAAATEAKTYYDLQELSQRINEQVELFDEQRDLFFSKFDSTIFAINRAVTKLRDYLGLYSCAIFIPTRTALIEFMQKMGFTLDDSFEACILEEKLIFTRENENRREVITISEDLFVDGEIVEVRKAADADRLIQYTQKITPICDDSDDNLPF